MKLNQKSPRAVADCPAAELTDDIPPLFREAAAGSRRAGTPLRQCAR